MSTTTRTCPACGYTGTYTSPALADHHHRRHSCAKRLHQTAASRRRAQRALAGPTRDCRHPQTRHVHGTRAAYVRDLCRCAGCTAANTAASNAAHRQRTLGRWQPYIDATPAREHIYTLRAAGIGIDQIATLAGLSPSHVRALIYRSGGKPPIRRVRQRTADRLLAVRPNRANRAPHSHIDATGSRRRLQALATVGWTPARLAAELGRSASNLNRSIAGGRVTAETARQIHELYERLWNTRPPSDTPAQRAAAETARAHATRHSWLPPLAWDDIDNDPDHDLSHPAETGPAVGDLDPIAIERAIAGDGIHLTHLTAPEQDEVVRRLTESGKSIRDIAAQLATSTRSVSRRRRSVFAA